jgi:phospholipid transport system substrate-binding protein
MLTAAALLLTVTATAVSVEAPPARPAAAARGPGDPLLKLRRTDAAIRAAVGWRIPDWSPEAAVRQARIDGLLAELLDYDEISRRTLQSTWPALSPADRRAFVETFSALAGHAFLASLTRDGTRQRYESESVAGGQASVLAKEETPGGAPGPAKQIEFKLALARQRWLVTDVIVDGTSLVECYRDQFSRLLKREGLHGLIARMQSRLASGGSFGATN